MIIISTPINEGKFAFTNSADADPYHLIQFVFTALLSLPTKHCLPQLD